MAQDSPYAYLLAWRLPEDFAEMLTERAAILPSEVAPEPTEFLLEAARHLIHLWDAAIHKPSMLPSNVLFEDRNVESESVLALVVARLMFAYGGVVGGLMLKSPDAFPFEIPGISDFTERDYLPFEPGHFDPKTLASRSPDREAWVSYLYLRALSFSWQSMVARLAGRGARLEYITAACEYEMQQAASELFHLQGFVPFNDVLRIAIHTALSDLDLKRKSFLRFLLFLKGAELNELERSSRHENSEGDLVLAAKRSQSRASEIPLPLFEEYMNKAGSRIRLDIG